MPRSRLQALATSPLLLVGTDFDGTISALAPTPAQARADPRCLAALERLARLPCTRVAVVSGRPLAWLREAVRTIPRVVLFGSHGAEDGSVAPGGADPPAAEVLARVAARVEALAGRWPGCIVERKPFAIGLHYRRAHPAHAAAIIAAVREVADATPGVSIRAGSMVVELCVSTMHKGDAIARARYLSGGVHTVFFGDDTTDEDAFAALGDQDFSIKVGAGETAADASVGGIADVAEALELLGEQRERWLGARPVAPIERHSILSDQRTLAVVTPAARVSWLCLPRIDSPALFGELLGGPAAGFFAVESEDGAPHTAQSYIGDSMLLRTSWREFTVTDYLDCSGGRAYQRAGRSDLVRILEGRGRVRVTFAPRPDFGRVPATLELRDGGVEVTSTSEPCVLYAPGVAWAIDHSGPHQTARATIDLDAPSGPHTLELRFGAANLRPSVVPEPQRRAQTQRHWSGWAGALRVPPALRALLVRSALTIKALCDGPGGAIVAAGTTSLPEQLGGVRNWDYRFCWPRDAAMAATALLKLGNTGHAMKLTEWLTGIVDRLESPDRLRPIYAVRGEELGPEAEIGSLDGYAGSRPVRVSNAAAQQVQLDVFGPIVHMVASLIESGVAVSPDAWRLVRAMVQAVEARWGEPDHGIWEIRGPRRHHVHSKVMCWHAVDRALVVHDAVLGEDNAAWRSLRDRIAADVLEKGWNESARAFTGAYGSTELDAASLMIGLTGLLSRADPRWHATVEAVEEHLREGAEGGLVICACWLVEAMVTLGRMDDARQLFEGILGQAGPTGLFAEQWDPAHALALGNFPQAYSHLGVINAALALAASDA